MKKTGSNVYGKLQGRLAGLTTLEVVFYILSFPILIILAGVFGYEMYQLVPYYSFWPFVGTILAAVLGLVFLIVSLCVTRKKSKRPIRSQTVILIVTVICLTSVIGVALDVLLPDILASLTSSTLFYEDMQYDYETQAEANASIVREFIMLSIFTGNYDPEYSYENLKNNSVVQKTVTGTYVPFLSSITTKAEYEEQLWNNMTELDRELFTFVYNKWILTDIDYAFKSPDREFGNIQRLAFGHAVTDYVSDVYAKLAKEGMNNKRIAYLFNNNYASLHQDGYITYDDAFILYATSNRMTAPVIVRLLLDQGYSYSDDRTAYMENGEIVEPDDVYFFELYTTEATVQALKDADALEWNNSHTRALVTKEVKGVDVALNAVFVPAVDAEGKANGGYIRQPMKWSILDMDGKNMDVASIGDVTIDLSFIAGILPDSLNSIKGMLAKPLTIGELFDVLNAALRLIIDQQTSVEGLIGSLLTNVEDVIKAATGGKTLHLGINVDDSGALNIAISPSNVERGLLGYQYMTWMQSNNLLFAVISVMSLRNWLFIIGAVSVLMVFAAGCCREFKKRIKDDFDAKYVEVEAGAAGDQPDEQAAASYDEAQAPAEDSAGEPADNAATDAETSDEV